MRDINDLIGGTREASYDLAENQFPHNVKQFPLCRHHGRAPGRGGIFKCGWDKEDKLFSTTISMGGKNDR